MNKFLVIFLVLFLLTVNSIFVSGAEIHKFNLQAAINRVLVENVELKKAELNFEKARLEYEKAKANNLLEQSNYNELEAEYNLNDAKKTYKETRDSVIKTTIQQYTNVWLNKLNIEVKEKTVAAEKRLLEQYKAQYEIGDLSNIDLLEQKNTYKDACFELEKIKDEYTQSLKQFKITLGLEGSKIEIKPLEEPEIWDIDEQEAIETALKNSLKLQLSKKEEELAQIDQKRARISDSELNVDIKEVTLKIIRMEIKNIKEEITTSTQETYYQFKQAIKDIDLKKERLSKDKEEYNLVKKQYEAGISTKTDVLQYEASMLETEYNYKEAIADYYLAEHSLREALDLETGVFIDENDAEN